MSNWTTDARPGYRSMTIQRGNCTIVIHRPLLTQEETAKRERQVLDALESTMRAYTYRKEKNA